MVSIRSAAPLRRGSSSRACSRTSAAQTESALASATTDTLRTGHSFLSFSNRAINTGFPSPAHRAAADTLATNARASRFNGSANPTRGRSLSASIRRTSATS